MMKQLFISIACASFLVFPVFAQNPVETENWNAKPKIVNTGSNHGIPSDAIILFKNKTDLGKWTSDSGEANWNVKGNKLEASRKGSIWTKQSFGDVQLHVEWRSPKKVVSHGQGRGNSGVFLQKRYEVQVLDSYDNQTYYNGQAGSIYKQHAPLVNASREPGKWQSYDIVYFAPRFNLDGSLKEAARMTVFHNGVLIQYDVEVKGLTVYVGKPYYEAHGKAPILLQDHSNPIQYRNIWVREL